MKYPKQTDIYDIDIFNENFKELYEKIYDNNTNQTNNLAKKADKSYVDEADSDIREYIDELENNIREDFFSDLEGKANKYCYIVSAYDSSNTYKKNSDLCCSQYNAQNDINNLLNKIPEGAVVIFSPGNYLLSDGCIITKSVNIVGSGIKTKFYSSKISNVGTNVFTINSDGVKISNLFMTVANYYYGGKYYYGDGTQADSEYRDASYFSALLTTNTGFDSVTLRDILFCKEIEAADNTNNSIIRPLEGKKMSNLIIDCCKFRVNEDNNKSVKCIDYNKGSGSLILANCICTTTLKVKLSTGVAFFDNSYNVVKVEA